MTKTENYQLNQWDPEDRVTHTDFNADNAKLDATLKTLDTGLGSLNTALSSLSATVAGKMDTAAGNAAIAEKCHIATGAYVGDGAASRSINLGFRPKVVLLWNTRGFQYSSVSPGQYFGGLILDDPAVAAAATIGQITSSGFSVTYNLTTQIYSNASNYVYFYMAFC